MLLEPARRGRTGVRDALQLAAETWGAARTWALPSREQAGVAACLALRSARGRQVVVQRDVDATVIDGLIVSGLEPHWLAPELDPIAGVAHGVTAAALDAALTAAPGARAAIVVAPTTSGAMPDVALLAAVAHGHGAALVVDETWARICPSIPRCPSMRWRPAAHWCSRGSAAWRRCTRAGTRSPGSRPPRSTAPSA